MSLNPATAGDAAPERKRKSHSAETPKRPAAKPSKSPEFYLPAGFPDFSKAPVSSSLGFDIGAEHPHRFKKVPALETSYLRTLLRHRDPFMAFCSGLEEPLLKAYDDGVGNQTIGIGYCIPARVRTYGKERVVSDFMAAGLNREQAVALANQDKEALRTIKLTPHGAVALLEVIKPDYERVAKAAVGEKTWDKLPENKQVALTYMVYNTGHLEPDLVANVRSGNDAAAMSGNNMMPKLSTGENHILRGRVQAAFLSQDMFEKVINNPGEIDAKYGNPQGQHALPNMALLASQRLQSLAGRLREKQKQRHDDHPDHGHAAKGHSRGRGNDA